MTTSTAAQTLFSKDPSLAAAGGRIALRGFPADETERIKGRVQSAGWTVVPALLGADAVLTGPTVDPATLAVVQRNNITTLTLDELDVFQQRAAGVRPMVAIQTPAPDEPAIPAFETTPDGLRLLDLHLRWTPGEGGVVPGRERVQHLCVDANLLRCALSIVLGATHGFPVALEGETATTKTTAILWVAHLLGQPVLRLNLNGQSDTSELVGRYVPVASEDPSGAARTGWRFQEGTIPQALRKGWWVILDEMNLAEPQILERINPVLESPPSLVLSEGAGTIFGEGGVPVHPAFRVLGTMNPADYSGRSTLSPAFRDRWGLWTFVSPPGDQHIVDTVRCFVTGRQPVVAIRGRNYQAPPAVPLFPELAETPDLEDWTQRLALFHQSMVRSAGGQDAKVTLGRLRRERYVFSRRTLRHALQLAAADVRLWGPSRIAEALRDAVERVYLDRLQDPADRAAVQSIRRAHGLM